MSMKVQEALAVLTVACILVGLPVVVWYYESVVRPAGFGDDAQVFTLTAVADGGLWTTEAVQGQNYWRRSFPRAAVLQVDPARPVVLRLRSADLLHSFSIPALRIRPIDVYAGHEAVVRLEPEDLDGEDELGFLCYQLCGPDHQHMSGALLVSAPDEARSDTIVATASSR